MPGENQIERLAHRRKLGVLQRALGDRGRMAGGEQQGVLLAQGEIEVPDDPQQRLAPGPRAPGLDEAQMAGRDPGVERQIQLRASSTLAPLAQQRADLALGARGSPSRGTLPAGVSRLITPR